MGLDTWTHGLRMLEIEYRDVRAVGSIRFSLFGIGGLGGGKEVGAGCRVAVFDDLTTF